MPRKELRALAATVAAFAGRRPFSIEDAARHGIERHRLARASRAGVLLRVGPGQYILGGEVLGEMDAGRPGLGELDLARARCRIDVLARRGIPAVLGGCSAAKASDIPLFGRNGPPDSTTLTLLVPRGCGVREGTRGGVRLRTADLHRDDVVDHFGVPMTRPLRTGLDVARDLGRCRASSLIPLSAAVRAEARTIVALHGDASSHEVTAALVAGAPLRDDLLGRLASLIERVNNHGMAWVRRVLPDIEPLLETALEGLAWATLTASDLPRPEPQRWVRGASGKHYRVDFLLGGRVIIEADGSTKYGTTTPWLEKQRQSDLEAAGYWVVRCTWEELLRRPDAVIARVRLALARCAL